MKKIMLLMAAALVSLSACSKSANEPVVKNQDDEVLESINLHIEGEREPISVIDENGRALDVKATVEDNLIKGITPSGDGEVDGIIYVFNPNGTFNPAHINGFARQVKFKVHGNKISFNGTLGKTRLRRGQLTFLKMNVYIGGHIKDQSIEPNGVNDPQGGSVAYYFPKRCVKTEDGMNLASLDPIFYSEMMDITVGKDGQVQDYYSTGHKFKLFGEFISCRVRVGRLNTSVQGKYNGFLLRGFGLEGAILEAPDKNHWNRPYWRKSMASANRSADQATFIEIPGRPTYYIKADGSAPTLTPAIPDSKNDDAFTFYLFTPVESQGGIRPSYNRRADIFTPSKPWVTKYWGTNGDATPHSSKANNRSKFHNLILNLM